jgi:hypothetical protein
MGASDKRQLDLKTTSSLVVFAKRGRKAGSFQVIRSSLKSAVKMHIAGGGCHAPKDDCILICG